MKNNDEKYIDHEVRIRLMEKLHKMMESKMNTALLLIIGSILIPVGLKILGL